MQDHIGYCSSHGLKCLSGDIAGFDVLVIPELWQYLVNGMASWFRSEERFFKALNRSVITHCRVLSPTGVMRSGPSSIKSGSGGTNFIDSQYNKLAIYYGEEIGLYKAESYAVQGDDFILAGVGVEPDAVAEAYSHLGLTVHPDKKNFAAGRSNFLQRLHIEGWKGGIASVYRVLASCLVYEKLVYSSNQWNPYLETIQLVSKLENAAFHPAFSAVVEYVASLDKYQLFRAATGREILERAGHNAADLLARDSASSISTRTLDPGKDGFSMSATNGVLRGEKLPAVGSDARFQRVYGEKRISAISQAR